MNVCVSYSVLAASGMNEAKLHSADYHYYVQLRRVLVFFCPGVNTLGLPVRFLTSEVLARIAYRI